MMPTWDEVHGCTIHATLHRQVVGRHSVQISCLYQLLQSSPAKRQQSHSPYSVEVDSSTVTSPATAAPTVASTTSVPSTGEMMAYFVLYKPKVTYFFPQVYANSRCTLLQNLTTRTAEKNHIITQSDWKL